MNATGSAAAPDPQTPDLRSDARRNQRRILLAAARVLADDPAASMQRIADEAEVARPTVYRRYPTREVLIEAIGREAIEEFAAALDAAQDQDEDSAATLTRLIRALARIGADYPIVLAGGTHAHDTAAVVERVDSLIVRGQAAGELRADVTSEVLRHALFGALTAGLRLARADGPAADNGASRPDPEAIGAQIAAILVEGMRAEK
ncbi:hypothetical protein GCM10009839_31840 [Catenulispora yoronensis]|uniref:HTH tetR-type domain-containing protein n=1 Tax=Catenulispora yoronensis TaxID=450799 RepID=A0ABP5FR96_9ACTN